MVFQRFLVVCLLHGLFLLLSQLHLHLLHQLFLQEHFVGKLGRTQLYLVLGTADWGLGRGTVLCLKVRYQLLNLAFVALDEALLFVRNQDASALHGVITALFEAKVG